MDGTFHEPSRSLTGCWALFTDQVNESQNFYRSNRSRSGNQHPHILMTRIEIR